MKVVVATVGGLHELGGGIGLAGQAVTSVAPGSQPERWWATTDGRRLWSCDGDGRWEPVAEVRVLRATCLADTPAGLLVGTSEAHLLVLDGDRLETVGAFERAEDRASWYTPWGGPPATRSVAASDDGTLYVNVHVGGISRARRLDGPWSATIDVDADVHQVVEADGRVFAATARGLAISDDAGDTWAFHTGGLHGRYLRAVAVADGYVLVTASTGHASRRAAVYRAPLADPGGLVRCHDGLPQWFGGNLDTGWLAAAAGRVALASPDGDVYVSDDAGGRWRRETRGLPPIRGVAVARRGTS